MIAIFNLIQSITIIAQYCIILKLFYFNFQNINYQFIPGFQQMQKQKQHISLSQILNWTLLQHRISKPLIVAFRFNKDTIQSSYDLKMKAIFLQSYSILLLKQINYLNLDLIAFVQKISNIAVGQIKPIEKVRKTKQKKRVRQRITKNAQNIQILSQQSISNPKNIEIGRNKQGSNQNIQVGNILNQNSNKESSSGLGSNHNFQNQLEKAQAKIALNNDQFNDIPRNLDNQDISYIDLNFNEEVNSNSNSSKASSDAIITNLAQKMKILFSDQKKIDKNTKKKSQISAIKKKRGDAIRTKRKHEQTLIDQITTITENARYIQQKNIPISLNASHSKFLDFNQSKDKNDMDKELLLVSDQYQPPQFNVDANTLFSSQNMNNLKILNNELIRNVSSNRIKDRKIQELNDIVHSQSFVNQNNSMNLSSNFQEIMNQISTNKKKESDSGLKYKKIIESEATFQNIYKKANKSNKKSKAEVLYDLLILVQEKKILLQQQNPEIFSPIQVIVLSEVL